MNSDRWQDLGGNGYLSPDVQGRQNREHVTQTHTHSLHTNTQGMSWFILEKEKKLQHKKMVVFSMGKASIGIPSVCEALSPLGVAVAIDLLLLLCYSNSEGDIPFVIWLRVPILGIVPARLIFSLRVLCCSFFCRPFALT